MFQLIFQIMFSNKCFKQWVHRDKIFSETETVFKTWIEHIKYNKQTIYFLNKKSNISPTTHPTNTNQTHINTLLGLSNEQSIGTWDMMCAVRRLKWLEVGATVAQDVIPPKGCRHYGVIYLMFNYFYEFKTIGGIMTPYI